MDVLNDLRWFTLSKVDGKNTNLCISFSNHFIVEVIIIVKRIVNMCLLLVWAKCKCFRLRNSKRDEQVEWFELIGHMRYQKRLLVFSPFQAEKNAFFKQKWGRISQSRKFKKVPTQWQILKIERRTFHTNLTESNELRVMKCFLNAD